MVSTPSFGVVILQGVVGSMPGAAFAFTTLYFQARSAWKRPGRLWHAVLAAAAVAAAGELLGFPASAVSCVPWARAHRPALRNVLSSTPPPPPSLAALQLLGFSDAQASTILAVFNFSGAVGALLGGVVGDWAAGAAPAGMQAAGRSLACGAAGSCTAVSPSSPPPCGLQACLPTMAACWLHSSAWAAACRS